MPIQNSILDLVQLVRSTMAAPFIGFALMLCAIAYARLRAGRL